MPVDDCSKGVVFYLSREDRKVVGVLTWNIFGKMDVAKKVYVLLLPTNHVSLVLSSDHCRGDC